MLAVMLAITATVALLCSMAFFLMGSLPLLILKHDTPLDGRFIRGLFNVYYVAVMVAATAATVAFAFAGRAGFAAGMACIAILATVLRRVVLARMDSLRETMTATDAAGISSFRRLHVGGMVLNAVQLGAVAWSLTLLAL